jgi:endonuclease III
MLTIAEFKQLLAVTGSSVTFTKVKAPSVTTSIRAIMQSTSKAPEAIINSFGVNGVGFQIAADALDTPPEKFDVVVDTDGHRYVIETVVTHHSRGSGTPSSYSMYAKGR